MFVLFFLPNGNGGKGGASALPGDFLIVFLTSRLGSREDVQGEIQGAAGGDSGEGAVFE